MKIYDTLIVGAGYFSVGYATKNGNTVICEERQALDTAFCLPFRGFTHVPYTPKTAEGERAYEETKDFFNYVLKLTDRQ